MKITALVSLALLAAPLGATPVEQRRAENPKDSTSIVTVKSPQLPPGASFSNIERNFKPVDKFTASPADKRAFKRADKPDDKPADDKPADDKPADDKPLTMSQLLDCSRLFASCIAKATPALKLHQTKMSTMTLSQLVSDENVDLPKELVIDLAKNMRCDECANVMKMCIPPRHRVAIQNAMHSIVTPSRH